MYYINPYSILGINEANLSDIDIATISRAKKKLLAEIELSDSKTIIYNEVELNKGDCLRAIDDLDNRDKKEFHFFICKNEHLNKFLTSGTLSFFENYQEESIYKLPEFIDFISPFFCEQYNKILSRNFQKGNAEAVSSILSVKPIVDKNKFENCFNNTYNILKNIEEEISLFSKKIKNRISPFVNSQYLTLQALVLSKVNITLLNLLPNYFLGMRSKIAESIRLLAIDAYNSYPRFEINTAFEIINIAKSISSNSLTEIRINKTYNELNEINIKINGQRIKNGEPIDEAPLMQTTNGFGTTIYNDTLYFVVFFIPIFPIARYSLKYDGNNTYRFFGKLKLHKWQKTWQLIMVGGIAILIVIAIINSYR